MPAVSRRAERVLAPDPPPSCVLCGGDAFGVRFRATAASPSADASSFSCTSFGHRRHATIWECHGCGLVVQWPQPGEDDLVEAYRAVEDPTYTAERENRYFTFRRVVRELGSADGRRLLDVGAYCGYFVDVADAAGFAAEGLELSTWAVEQARSLGLTIHQERLAERAAAGDRYDVVTLWDVIEHVADPVAELGAVRELLHPGGRVYLSTIDAHSAFARAMGSRWPWLMEMHLFYFDPETIRRGLEDAGLRLLEVRSYTHVVSARYLLAKLAATAPAVARPLRRLAESVPSGWRIPVNVGDNMLVVAERPC